MNRPTSAVEAVPPRSGVRTLLAVLFSQAAGWRRVLPCSQPFEHHRAAPNLADGVGDALACDVRGTAVHWLEQARAFAVRVDVGAGCDADGASTGRAEVGQDVAERLLATTTSKNAGRCTKCAVRMSMWEICRV